MAVKPQTTQQLDFHHGETLLKLSDTYPTLAKSMLEMIQNALDASAQHIFVSIDLHKREAVVMDDGEGITREKFNQALMSVGRTIKSKRNKLGRFGLGLISPLRKVKFYTVTSFPLGASSPVCWTFNAGQIKNQADRVNIPVNTLGRFTPEKTDWDVQATWRTIVKLVGITSDKVISMIDLDNFEDDLLSNFGQAMRIHGAICRIVLVNEAGKQTFRDIRPKEYSGIKLGKVTYNEADAGEVVLELFRTKSRTGQRAGVVSVKVKDDLFLVSWKDFLRQARGADWLEATPAFDALGSGFFEGTITAEKIELSPSRTKFVFNDALIGLYAVIDRWYSEHGDQHLHDEKEKARSERLQQLGLKSLERWTRLLDNPDYHALREALLGTFVYGRLGEGHVMPHPKTPEDFEEGPSLRTGQGGVNVPRTPRGETARETAPHDPHRPGDLPMTSRGPRGNIRQLIRNDSLGLQLAHEPLDSPNLWELDQTLGVLYFNTTHRVWEMCEAKDYRVLHLQDWVIMQVLHLMTLPQDRFEDYRILVDQQARSYVELFVISSPPKRL